MKVQLNYIDQMTLHNNVNIDFKMVQSWYKLYFTMYIFLINIINKQYQNQD